MIRALFAAVLLILPLSAKAATDIQEITTPGGVTVWLVEEPSIPIVSLQISFKGGSSIDPVGKEGVTNLMMGLLEEGSGEMNAQEFLEAQEALAARFDWDAYRDTVSIDAEMLKENLDASIDLLRQAMVSPTFDEVAVERVRSQVLSILDANATDPDEIVDETFWRLGFPGHPYGIGDAGTVDSVTALTRDDIVAAHKAALVRSRIVVGAVGDITAEELSAIIDRLVEGLAEDGPPLPEKTELAFGGGTTIVDFAVPQSVAIFGHAGMERDDPDYLEAYILSEIMGGGGLESRLSTEVREKRGLTYGVYTYLSPFDSAPLLLGSLASSNAAMAEALSVVGDEWRRMAEEGITAEELAAAKLYLTGAYPLRFDSNVKIASILVGLQLSDLPIDYIKTRNDKVEAVTLEDINRVAKRLFQPEALRFVVVGQPDGLVATD